MTFCRGFASAGPDKANQTEMKHQRSLPLVAVPLFGYSETNLFWLGKASRSFLGGQAPGLLLGRLKLQAQFIRYLLWASDASLQAGLLAHHGAAGVGQKALAASFPPTGAARAGESSCLWRIRPRGWTPDLGADAAEPGAAAH